MDLNLKGKVAIVTGAGRGIGRGIALTFAEEGANVVIADMVEETAKKVAEEAEALGGEALAVKVDVTKLEEANQMAKAALDKFGKIDILVNNAAIFVIKRFAALTTEEWDKEINVIYYGVLNCSRAVMDHMVERKSGTIVNMASDAGRVGEPTQPVYSGAKGGVIAFTKALAKDLARHSIRVNAVAPSMTETEGALMALRGPEGTIESLRSEAILRNYPLGKLGKPQDVANMVVFLASDRADHITGQTISVNGGYCMV